MNLDQAPKDLIRELGEAGVPLEVMKAALNTRPIGTDKRLTAPLAIRSRRARMLVAELYAWVHEGEVLVDVVDELNYLTGISQRTLSDYFAGITKKGRIREVEGRIKRAEV